MKGKDLHICNKRSFKFLMCPGMCNLHSVWQTSSVDPPVF